MRGPRASRMSRDGGPIEERQRASDRCSGDWQCSGFRFSMCFFPLRFEPAPRSRARYLARCTCETCTVKRFRLSRATTDLLRRRRRRNAAIGTQYTRCPPLLNASPRGEAGSQPTPHQPLRRAAAGYQPEDDQSSERAPAPRGLLRVEGKCRCHRAPLGVQPKSTRRLT